MPEPVFAEEKTPVSIPPSLMFTKPPALMSTLGETLTSGFSPPSFQSSAGNLAIQGAAAEPDRITTPEGDSLPRPVIVGWAEPFEISFAPRTNPFGDVHLRIRFRYRGAQTPERPDDQDYTIELYPAPELPTSGVPQDRRLNVRIVDATNTSLGIDPYGDGKVYYLITDELKPPRSNGARDHQIEIYRNDIPHASVYMRFTSSGGKPVPGVGQGIIVPAAPEVTKPAFEPDPEHAPDLPAEMLMQMALGRLAGLKIKPLKLLFWAMRLRADLPTNMSVANEPTIRHQLRRLLDLLAYMGPVFTTLEALTEKEQYLGGLADVATARVWQMVALYGDAILSSYYGGSPTNEPLAEADKLLADFPAWLNRLYLLDPRGVKSLIEKIPELQDELREWQDRNDPSYRERLARADAGTNRLERLTMLTWKGKGPLTLYGAREAEREDVEWAWRGEKDYVQERIKGLYASVQSDIGILTAMTVYEQLRYLSHELNSSIINDVIELTWAANRADQAEDYEIQLWHILNEFEENSQLSNGQEKQAAVQVTLEKLQKLLNDGKFKSGVDAINSRLTWVNRIDVAGKLALIVAAAALTGGVAGAVAGEFGAGSVGVGIASSFGFTAVSRLGQQLVFGKVEGSFIGDWVLNFATLGVLSKASAGLAKIIKLPAGAGKLTTLSVKLGRAGGAMIALHAVTEVQTLITEHRLMTGDERDEAMFTNVFLTVTLHAGKFITDPIEERITKGVLDTLRLDKRIADRIDRVEAKRRTGGLKDRLAELEKRELPAREVDKVINEINEAWYEDLKIIDDAAHSETLPASELDTAISAYREHIAGMQLQMSRLGVEAPSPSGHTTFRPIESGVIAFAPEGRPALEAFYVADPAMPGKSLTESASMPGVLEGRMPTGEITYFVPEGEVGTIDVLPSKPVSAPTEAMPASPTVTGPPSVSAPPPKMRGAAAEGTGLEFAHEVQPEPSSPPLVEFKPTKANRAAVRRALETAAVQTTAAKEASLAADKVALARAGVAVAEGDLQAAKELAGEVGNTGEGQGLIKQQEKLLNESKEALRQAQAELKKRERAATVSQLEADEVKRTGEEINKLQVEIGRLDAAMKAARHPPGGFTNEQRDAGRRPGRPPRLLEPGGAEYAELERQRAIAANELKGEVKGLTRSIDGQVNAAVPGPEGKPVALKNAASLDKPLHPINGVPIDVTTGLPMTSSTWAVDHILARNLIKMDPRFRYLTWAQREHMLLGVQENYLPMTIEANGTKGDFTVEEWIAYQDKIGRPLPETIVKPLLEADKRARAAIEKLYNQYLPNWSK